MKSGEFMWAGLFHFGSHMWNDAKENEPLELDYGEWKRITDRMAAVGMNAIVVDVGEGVVWPSHPELAVEGSWPVEKFRAELARMRALGLEVIPKVNFSTTHDAWLKDYGRMVSTPDYYRVCADIVRDTVEIFDRPRLFHLGYDEEAAHHQRNYSYAVIRQGELWWHDFLWFVKETEKTGARPWIWSDYLWSHEKEFLSRMPKSVLQSNWYYGKTFDADECVRLKNETPKDWSHGVNFFRAYETLEKAGFDQVPTSSNFCHDENILETVRFCAAKLDNPRLKGIMVAPWFMTTRKNREKNIFAIEETGRSIAWAKANGRDWK